MPAKPTYEELEKRNQELEKKISLLMKLEKDLKESKEYFSEMFDHMPSGVAIFNDVTEPKQAEQKIIQYSKFLQQLMETSPVGITVVSRDGNISLANKLAEKILGLQKSDIFNRQYNDPSWCITDFNGNPYPEEKLPFNLVKKKVTPVYGVEHAIEWPDGKRVFLSINAAPLIDNNNYFDGMVAVIEDITERKQIEKERDNLIKELRKTLKEVKTLSGLLPICSHCKKVRDDKGYWNQLEEYVIKHSDANFSHGICPDCIKKYYSDLIL